MGFTLKIDFYLFPHAPILKRDQHIFIHYTKNNSIGHVNIPREYFSS